MDMFPALLVPARPMMPPRSFIFLPSPESGVWELDEEAPRCIPRPPPTPPTGDAEELFIAAAPSADDDADAIMDERCLTSMGGSLARNDWYDSRVIPVVDVIRTGAEVEMVVTSV